MRIRICTIFAVLMAAGWCAGVAPAKKAERPTKGVEPAGCVTSECHANIKSHRAIHGPVNTNDCDACHELRDAKLHTYALSRQKAELCTFCHDFDASKTPVVHAPVLLGECLGCHDPHGGKTTAFVKGNTSAELCGQCHENITAGKKFVHTPVTAGECDSCHAPHGSTYPKLLDVQGQEMCLSCHTDFDNRMAAARFKHKAMDKGCAQCHDVHGSSEPMQMTKAVPELCVGCHEKTQREVASYEYKHTVVTGERACLTCHTPHGGDLSGLMADLPANVCMSCHDRPQKAGDRRMIPAAGEVLDPSMPKHGPVRDGQCNGCHTPHGGSRPLFMAKSYHKSFYQPFVEENYQLCFMCHSARMVRDEKSADATQFRNGDKNLHHVHVFKDERSRNCRVCHTNHAAGNDRGVRDAIAFGKWKIPINFKRTPTGGTCLSGCHADYGYDRSNPLSGPTTLPSRAMAKLRPADPAEAARLAWTGRDTGGGDVIVPDSSHPTVAMFVRAKEDSVNAAVFKLAQRAELAGARTIVFVCGEGAPQHATDARASAPPAWRWVADTDESAARRFGVYSWPSTLIIDISGSRMTHLTSASESLPAQIGAYLELAAGKIDRNELTARLAKFEVLGDDPAKRAARHLRIATTLLDEGKAEQARGIVLEALRLSPDSPLLQAALADALIQLGKPQDGLAVLAKMSADAIPAWQYELLRGKASMAAGRWADARGQLGRVIKARPDLAEAHYLLGQAYEQAKDWQSAAKEYRLYSELKRKMGK